MGEKKHYNFQPGVTEYDLWPFSTIEWVPAEGKFMACAIVKHKTQNKVVVFNRKVGSDPTLAIQDVVSGATFGPNAMSLSAECRI